jgi:beta-glucosidase-like glycosyl hydrolase
MPITAAEAIAREAAAVLSDPEASEEEIDNAAEELLRAGEQMGAGKYSKKTAAKIAAIEEALDDAAAVLPARRKKTTVAKKPAPVPEPDVKADAVVVTADRAYVLDELTKRFADPKQKTQAKAFIDKVAGRHGGVRLSRLEPELFPQIREEMVVEFGLAGNNGHAGI